VPVLCEGTSRMTRAASDCTSEHGKNYFDSRLMSDKAMLQQLNACHRCACYFPKRLAHLRQYVSHAER
jgi:hypothetical protein